MAFEVELFESLDAAEADAAGALDRERRPSLFERLAWFRLIERHCPPPGRLLVARASREAWLFLASKGRKADSYAAWYSLRAGLIGDPAALPALVRSLPVASVELGPLENAEAVASGFRHAGWIAFASPATASWRTEIAGRDFAAWWASRPSRLRNTAERKAKAAGLEVEIHRSFDAEAWAAYEAVYRASWKPEEGSFPFLRALAEQEGAAGTLRLGIARTDGAPVAGQLWTVENGTAWIHKLAYRDDMKALSPGTVLSLAMFRAAIDEDRVERIDYGTGDEPYKADWMDERHRLWRVEAFNPRSLAGLAGAAQAAASALVGRWRSR